MHAVCLSTEMKFLLLYLSLALCYSFQDINADHEDHRQNHGKFIKSWKSRSVPCMYTIGHVYRLYEYMYIPVFQVSLQINMHTHKISAKNKMCMWYSRVWYSELDINFQCYSIWYMPELGYRHGTKFDADWHETANLSGINHEPFYINSSTKPLSTPRMWWQ